MNLIVNGETREVGDRVLLSEYLATLNIRSRMVVVEHNGEIVARDRHGEICLQPGDVLEIVQMMAGG